MTVVLPGDVVPLASTSAIKLGPGLLPTPSSSSSSLTAIRAGALGHIDPTTTSSHPSNKSSDNAYWVETNSSRYIPSPGDSVIAQITNRGAESYTLTLFSAHSATLPALSFEGATKRHKPNLKIGAIVYARVVSADRFTEPELTCVNPVTGKSDGFGDLKTTDERGEKNGHAMLFFISLGLARTLLTPACKVLKAVAGYFAFEAAVGQNGVVWVRAEEVKHVIAVGKVLDEADRGLVKHESGGKEMVEEGMDAEWVLKNRAINLDAKRVKAIVQEYL